MSGQIAEVVHRRLYLQMIEVRHGAVGQRQRQRNVRLAAEGQAIIVALVVVPTLEPVAFVADGERHGRRVRGQLQTERKRIVDGHDVLRRARLRRARPVCHVRVHHRVVLHVRALGVAVRGPVVAREPHEHVLVVRQVPHFDRAHDPMVRRLDDYVLQRYVAHVQSFPEVQVV